VKKLIVFSLTMIFCFLLVGCNNKQDTFSLDKEYYQNSKERLDSVIKDE